MNKKDDECERSQPTGLVYLLLPVAHKGLRPRFTSVCCFGSFIIMMIPRVGLDTQEFGELGDDLTEKIALEKPVNLILSIQTANITAKPPVSTCLHICLHTIVLVPKSTLARVCDKQWLACSTSIADFTVARKIY